jgi:hypothetical protein
MRIGFSCAAVGCPSAIAYVSTAPAAAKLSKLRFIVTSLNRVASCDETETRFHRRSHLRSDYAQASKFLRIGEPMAMAAAKD